MKSKLIPLAVIVLSLFVLNNSGYSSGGKHIQIITRGYIWSSPLLYDINHDGYREVIVGDMAGYVYCFDHLGNKLWEYYAGDAFDKTVSPFPDWFNPEVKNNTALGNINVQSSCAAGDIDGDTIPDIIVGIGGWVDPPGTPGGGTTTGFGPIGQGGILILNNDGTLKLLIRGWDTQDGLEGQIQDGFSDGYFSTPAIADVDNDGRLDFAIGGTDHNIHCFRMLNRSISRSAGSPSLGMSFYHLPCKDDVCAEPIYELDDDGDGKFNEDPAGVFTPFTLYKNRCFQYLNPPPPPYEMFPGYQGVDDDGDGFIDETICWDDDEDADQGDGPGYVWWDWVDEDEFEWPFRPGDSTVASPALVDITGDGYLEIIIGNASTGGGVLKPDRKFIPPGGALRVMDMQGREVGDFPQWIEQNINSSPSVGDIDGDGKMEIFVGTGAYFISGGEWIGKGLYAFKNDGSSYLPSTSPKGLFAMTDSIIRVAPAFGDVNGDGKLDVVAADYSGYVYAWDSVGNILSGFPVRPLEAGGYPGASVAHVKSSPILVDVDSDNLPEIVIGVGWQIIAINGDGTIVPHFIYPNAVVQYGTSSVFASPAAADLDNNGKIDLVWATGESTDVGVTIDNGIIHIWELGDYNPRANPWPMFKRTGTRTSAYTLQFENPVFEPGLPQIAAGDLIKVSIEVYAGLSEVSNVQFSIKVNGSLVQTNMVDDGTNGDAVAGDGRYTAVVQLPGQLSSISNISFAAEAENGDSAQLGLVWSQIFNPPTVTTCFATSITANSVTLNGRVDPNGLTTTYYFEFGTSEDYGLSTTPVSVGAGTNAVPVNGSPEGLDPNTEYHFRVVAENADGISLGDDKTFSTRILYTVLDGQCGDGELCYSSIQDAIDYPGTIFTICIAEGIYYEDIIVDEAKNIILRGGCSPWLTTSPSGTVIDGSMTLSNGAVTVENLVLQ